MPSADSLYRSLKNAFDTSQDAIREPDFATWKRTFMVKRLRLAILLLAAGNLAFIGMDYFLHHDQALHLALSRVKVSAATIGMCAFLWLPRAIRFAPLILAGFGFAINAVLANSFIFDVYATVTMFDVFAISSYYLTLTVAVLTVALLVPVYLPIHVLTQLAIIAFYVNRHFQTGIFPGEREALFSDAFHAVWIWLVADVLVYLQSRMLRSDFEARKLLLATNEKLSLANAKAGEIDQLKTDFFANISHELRTPLTLIVGAFQSLAKHARSTGIEKPVRSGLRNASRLMLMIEELLDLAKFDSGSMQLNKHSVDVVALVEKVKQNFEMGIVNRKIIVVSQRSQQVIEADANKLKTVLFNLVSNAIKYTDPETGRIEIRIDTFGDKLSIAIVDNGIGIRKDDLARIFERFVQSKPIDGGRRSGTGIGLALVQEIVDAHKGSIKVDSKIGGGSTFHILLPIGAPKGGELPTTDDEDTLADRLARELTFDDDRDASDPMYERDIVARQLAQAKPAESSGSPRADAPLVLVAEDNADLRRYLRDLLGARYRVVTATNGQAALQAAEAQPPDLIVTDMMMPEMTGSELLQAIRRSKNGELARTPVIFLTAQAATDARVAMLESGADDYLAKPFQEQELLARVHNLLRARSQERELAQLNDLLERRVEEQMTELARTGELKRYLPAEVTRRILAGEIAPEQGFRRERISVLFADLVGYTDLVARLEPEEAAMLLNEYLAEMTAVTVAHKGIVDKFVGDAVMALFGPPLLAEPFAHASAAVHAGLAMQLTIEKLNNRWKNQGINADVQLRVGIQTGFVTVGFFGSDLQRNYTAVGTPVNVAARLQADAQPGAVVCGDATYLLLRDICTAQPLGEIQLKGITHAVARYAIQTVL